MRLLARVREYPLVLATIAAAIVGGLLALVAPGTVRWVLGAFCLAIAARSFWSVIQQIRQRSFGLDILAATSIIAAVLVGEYWAALVIVLMVASGEALEDYAAGKAKRDLTSLVSNAPQVAHVVGADGAVSDVAVDQVVTGATVLVRSHEMVPLDGLLASPQGTFDESSLTGESLPVERVAGDEVLSGSVNGAAAVNLTVTRVAKDSQYQQIVALVEEAAESRSPMVRLADRYALPFTALALLLAGIAWAISGDPVRFAQVLVVATPCPLLIATPVAFMGGISRAARAGAIIRSSETLEKLHNARAFGFDKTGTLTRGKPELVDVRPAGGIDAARLLFLAASAEQGSAHVLADALVAGAEAHGVTLATPQDVHEVTGGGITAAVPNADGSGTHQVAVGKVAFVADVAGTQLPAPTLEPGELAVHVLVDGRYAGYVVLRDQLRPEAGATMAALRHSGIGHIAMFTGDEAATANYIAQQIGINDVHAACLPADKVAGVGAIADRPVVMVGDGVNDAPVLAAADVGIAMAARGATAASESADVVILKDDVSTVATTLEIGQQTVRIAKQAIWIGITISVALMLFAMTGNLPALVGAWLQEAVDVIAILWALRAAGRAIFRRQEAVALPA